MKIVLEKEKCIGCGSCAMLCPRYFKMAGDGKSEIIEGERNDDTGNYELEIQEVDCAQDAVDACPVQIIHINR